MTYCFIECSCGNRVYAKTALTPEVRDDLQIRLWTHIETVENHDPVTWERILELPIDVDLSMPQLQVFLTCFATVLPFFLVSRTSSALQDGAHQLPDPLPLWQDIQHFP